MIEHSIKEHVNMCINSEMKKNIRHYLASYIMYTSQQKEDFFLREWTNVFKKRMELSKNSKNTQMTVW